MTKYTAAVLKVAWLNALMAASLPALGEGVELLYQSAGVQTVEFRHASNADRSKAEVPQVVMAQVDAPERLALDFDELDRPARQLYYVFRHCTARWEVSDLMDLEFCRDFNRFYGFDSYQASFNTTIDYYHYHIDIDTSPLFISGNFLVEVYDAADETLLLRVPLWVSEHLCTLSSRVVREAEQQVQLSINWPSHGIDSPEQQLTVAVWQNKRLDDIRYPERPTYLRGDGLAYVDLPELLFDAAQEWRWLDTRSIKVASFSRAHIEFHKPFYHFTAEADGTPRGYSYHKDFNGGAWVETRDLQGDPQVSADYCIAHFTYLPENVGLLTTHDVFVIGDATGWTPSPDNQLYADHDNMRFLGQHAVKQSLANYLYVARPKSRRRDVPRFNHTEGNFGPTENDYFIAVYVQRPGQTYQHLVAFKTHNTLRTTDDFIK